MLVALVIRIPEMKKISTIDSPLDPKNVLALETWPGAEHSTSCHGATLQNMTPSPLHFSRSWQRAKMAENQHR